jgi:hypothetical protein
MMITNELNEKPVFTDYLRTILIFDMGKLGLAVEIFS